MTSISNRNNLVLSHFDFVIPVLHKKQQLAFLCFSDIQLNRSMSNENEILEYLETLMNLTIISLENKKLSRKLRIKTKIFAYHVFTS